MGKMNVKLEPVDEESDIKGRRLHGTWFEVPITEQCFENVPAIVCSVKSEVDFEQLYIKQEISGSPDGGGSEGFDDDNLYSDDEPRYKESNAKGDVTKELIPTIKQEDSYDGGECSHSINRISERIPSSKETDDVAVSSGSLSSNTHERVREKKGVDYAINQFDIKQEILKSDLVAVVKLIKFVFHEQNFVCGVCFETFPFQHVLKIHRAVHGGVESTILKERVNDTKAIRDSKRLVVREKKFKCTECDYRCLQSTTLKRHYMVHSGEKPFKCNQCEHECRSYTHLKVHQMIHTGEKPFQCGECSFKCRTLSDMKVHSKTHSGEKPYTCDTCNYRCVASTTLKRHKTVHTGEKPLKCAECEFRCRTSYHMKVHHKVHSGAKLFRCSVCGYECVHATTLKIHQMIHSGDRPFKCAECFYKARTAYRLKKHMKVHLGDKSGDVTLGDSHRIALRL